MSVAEENRDSGGGDNGSASPDAARQEPGPARPAPAASAPAAGPGVDRKRARVTIEEYQPPARTIPYYRSLVSRLLVGAGESYALALTGAGSEVGVTTVVVGVGSGLAEDYSLEVALVDANFQSPALGNLAKGQPGFADVIAGRVELEDAMLRTDNDRLSLLPAGQPGKGRPPLLYREGVERCLEGLRRRYDWVLFDTAPVADAAETALLASQVDSVALVVQAARSRDDEIAAAIDMLKGTRANFSGIIFNRAPARRSRRLRLRVRT